MSREKQIEEMARSMCRFSQNAKCVECSDSCFFKDYAEKAYNAGYRKQSEAEWISVEERLPERNGRYLTHCKIEGQSLVCILYYCNVGGFNEGTVTHWMPLPEPPDMKGGAK